MNALVSDLPVEFIPAAGHALTGKPAARDGSFVEEFKDDFKTEIDAEPEKKEAAPEAAKPAAPVQSVKATPSAPEEPSKPAIASDDETYDDFSEFFDDNK